MLQGDDAQVAERICAEMSFREAPQPAVECAFCAKRFWSWWFFCPAHHCDYCGVATCDPCTPLFRTTASFALWAQDGVRICRVCIDINRDVVDFKECADKPTIDEYDAVVEVGLLIDLYNIHRGWKVRKSQVTQSAAVQGCAAVCVSMIGNFNAGKTWLINRLCGDQYRTLQLASGLNVHTDGLSVKLATLGHSRVNCAFLDTAGLKSPVSSVANLGHLMADRDPMQAMQYLLEEFKRRDELIRRVSCDFATVFLIVVGQLSFSDQLDFLQLVEFADGSRKNTTKQTVIVVHNLKHLTYAGVTREKSPETGLTYLESLERVYKVTSRKVLVHLHERNRRGDIDEMFGAFGQSDGTCGVEIRHLFVTGENLRDPDCMNDYVIEYLRTAIIPSHIPRAFSLFDTLADLVSVHARRLVDLPAGVPTATVRYHEQRGCLLGGVPAEAAPPAAATHKATPPPAETGTVENALMEAENLVCAWRQKADEEGTAEAREGLEQAEKARDLAHFAMASQQTLRRVDASTLTRLSQGVTPRRVRLDGSAGKRSGDDYVRYKVSRVSITMENNPCWIALVRILLPGLTAEGLARAREQLVWDKGLNMVARDGGDATLKIAFTAELTTFPSKQFASLVREAAKVTAQRPAAQIHPFALLTEKPMVAVVDVGNRPFGKIRTADFGERRQEDLVDLEIELHTKVRNVIFEFPVVVTYSQGELTVAVGVEHSENSWSDEAVPAEEPVDLATEANSSEVAEDDLDDGVNLHAQQRQVQNGDREAAAA